MKIPVIIKYMAEIGLMGEMWAVAHTIAICPSERGYKKGKQFLKNVLGYVVFETTIFLVKDGQVAHSHTLGDLTAAPWHFVLAVIK